MHDRAGREESELQLLLLERCVLAVAVLLSAPAGYKRDGKVVGELMLLHQDCFVRFVCVCVYVVVCGEWRKGFHQAGSVVVKSGKKWHHAPFASHFAERKEPSPYPVPRSMKDAFKASTLAVLASL